MPGICVPESTHKYFAKTLEKGLQILSLFNESRPSLTQTELSRITGINMTSTYRLINTLVILGYLRRDDDSKRIKVGTKAILLGNNFLKAADFLQIVKPMVDDFMRNFDCMPQLFFILIWRRPSRLFSRHPRLNYATTQLLLKSLVSWSSGLKQHGNPHRHCAK